MEYNLKNIEKIEINKSNIIITYNDKSKHTIPKDKNNISFIKDLKNQNDSPIVDHCI